MSDEELTNDDVKQAIIELRGGLPPKCDFCNKQTEPHNLHPEEAGMWACIECIERWKKEDKEQSTKDEILGANIRAIIEDFKDRGIDFTNRDTLGPAMLAMAIKNVVDRLEQEPKP